GPPLAGPRTSAAWGSGASYGSQTLWFSVGGTGGYSLTIDQLTEDVEVLQDATKTGTVTLSGDSSADVIFGTVTCDIQGLQDDPYGSLTGLGVAAATQVLDN